MKVIDKYLIWELLRNFLFSITFFTILLLVVRFGEKEMGTFIAKRMSVADSIKSLLLQVPGYFVQISPPSMLFAMFFSIGRMTQNNEITAMKASGISLYRIFLPIFVVASFIAIFLMIFNDQVVTWAVGKDAEIKKLGSHSSKTASKVVFMGSEKRAFYIDLISLNEQKMYNVNIQDFDDNDAIKSDLFAKELSWVDDTWHLKNVLLRTYDNGKWHEEKIDQKDMKMLIEPEVMVKVSQSLQSMSISELSRLIDYKKKTGQVVRKDLVSLHSILSFPFACFVMAVLGAPLFVMFGRSGVAVGFLITMFISFVYWGFAIAIFEAFGNNGKLPPMLSCWSANIIFLVIGTVFITKVPK